MRKFSDLEMQEIKRARETGLSCREVGDMFGTSRTTVSNIAMGVGSYRSDWVPAKERTKLKELRALEMEREIIVLHRQGLGYREIAISKRISIKVTKKIIKDYCLSLLHQEDQVRERGKKQQGLSYTGYKPTKLSHEQVKEMRELWEKDVSCWTLGRQFGVSRFTAYKVVRRKGAYGPRRQQAVNRNNLRNISKKSLTS